MKSVLYDDKKEFLDWLIHYEMSLHFRWISYVGNPFLQNLIARFFARRIRRRIRFLKKEQQRKQQLKELLRSLEL